MRVVFTISLLSRARVGASPTCGAPPWYGARSGSDGTPGAACPWDRARTAPRAARARNSCTSSYAVVHDGLVAVLLRVETDGAVNPHGSGAVVLEEQLVEVDVLANEEEQLLALLFGVDTDVHGLAGEVLRTAHAVDAGIDRLVSEAAVDVDGAEGLAQRLAQLPAEVDQGGELQLVGGVVYAVGLCPCGTGHLFVAEVRTQHEILSLCHNFFNFYSFILLPIAMVSAKLRQKKRRQKEKSVGVAFPGV